MEFTIKGEKVAGKLSVFALMLYEQEFEGADMLQEFYGVVDEENGGGIMPSKLWIATVKAMWACIKTADDSTPSFNTWAKENDDFNIMEVYETIQKEINEKLFRSAPAA